MNRIFQTIRSETAILLICLIAMVMRVWGLGYQSLWLDELTTMNETAPATSWGELLNYLKTGEHHPPLFFIVEKVSFNFFGYNPFVARIIPAIAGVAGVWAMYRLGKEILNKQLGLICAILTCVNYFCLAYSQEARPYSFAFLFATLSFTWFVKLMKDPSKRNMVWYAVLSLLLLYTHYYSLFVMAAQSVLALIFIFQEDGAQRRALARSFFIAAIIICIGYAPWLTHFIANLALHTFWIKEISPAFLQNYFFDYFGNADLLNPLMLFLLFSFFVKTAMNTESNDIRKLKENPLLFTFTLILFWIFVVLLIPYIRSLLVVPMLYPRYTIVILPAIILVLGYGIELFKQPVVKYSLLGLFVLLSLNQVFLVKNYYSKAIKTQFREMTQYIMQENAANFPIINEQTSWQQGYYLRQFNSVADVLPGKASDLVDSILHKTSDKYNLEGFWIAGAHGSVMPDTTTFWGLDTAYTLIQQKQFFDSWAQMYASKYGRSGGYFIFLYTDFTDGEQLPGQKQIALWSGSIHTKQVTLKRGDYKLFIKANGTAAAQVFPHLNIFINDKKIADFFVTAKIKEKEFTFGLSDETATVIRIEIDNDMMIPEKKEDRNVFVESIFVKMVR